jgi:hypothetical protein
VRLEAVRAGGRWLTSLAALDRFFAALTPAGSPAGEQPSPRSPSATRRAAAAAARELDRFGA